MSTKNLAKKNVGQKIYGKKFLLNKFYQNFLLNSESKKFVGKKN